MLRALPAGDSERSAVRAGSAGGGTGLLRLRGPALRSGTEPVGSAASGFRVRQGLAVALNFVLACLRS